MANLASNSAPRQALQLAKSREPFISLLDVTRQMSWAMRNILEKPMEDPLSGHGTIQGAVPAPDRAAGCHLL